MPEGREHEHDMASGWFRRSALLIQCPGKLAPKFARKDQSPSKQAFITFFFKVVEYINVSICQTKSVVPNDKVAQNLDYLAV